MSCFPFRIGTPYVQGSRFRSRDVSIEQLLRENAAVLISVLLSHLETPLGGLLGIPMAGVGHLRVRCLVGSPIEGSTMWERRLDALPREQGIPHTRFHWRLDTQVSRNLYVCESLSLSRNLLGFGGPNSSNMSWTRRNLTRGHAIV